MSLKIYSHDSCKSQKLMIHQNSFNDIGYVFVAISPFDDLSKHLQKFLFLRFTQNFIHSVPNCQNLKFENRFRQKIS